jgi:hypothetical protein
MLKVESGAIIKLDNSASIDVNGSLESNGNSSQIIKFVAKDEAQKGCQSYSAMVVKIA